MLFYEIINNDNNDNTLIFLKINIILAPKLPFSLVFALFSAFIILCGITHVVSSWMPWHQTYIVSAVVKVICAIVSLITAGALIDIIPKALELPLLAAQYKS